jgi:hypothetical protein
MKEYINMQERRQRKEERREKMHQEKMNILKALNDAQNK